MKWTEPVSVSIIKISTSGIVLTFFGIPIFKTGDVKQGRRLFEFKYSRYWNKHREWLLALGKKERTFSKSKLIVKEFIDDSYMKLSIKVTQVDGPVIIWLFSGTQIRYHTNNIERQDIKKVWIPHMDSKHPEWLCSIPNAFKHESEIRLKDCDEIQARYQRRYMHWLEKTLVNSNPA